MNGQRKMALIATLDRRIDERSLLPLAGSTAQTLHINVAFTRAARAYSLMKITRNINHSHSIYQGKYYIHSHSSIAIHNYDTSIFRNSSVGKNVHNFSKKSKKQIKRRRIDKINWLWAGHKAEISDKLFSNGLDIYQRTI